MTISSPKKSYNVDALRGGDYDDMEYVERFNLDPSVAYTPKINDAMLNLIERENTEHYISKGMPEAEAKAMARNKRMSAERDIKQLMK